MGTGDRSERAATELFGALSEEYRREAIFLTDFWAEFLTGAASAARPTG